jgi:hypothetical protein
MTFQELMEDIQHLRMRIFAEWGLVVPSGVRMLEEDEYGWEGGY